MPKARPVSLHPLSFDEAIKRLINFQPSQVNIAKKRQKKHADKTKSPKATKKIFPAA